MYSDNMLYLSYQEPHTLLENSWNNALSYGKRIHKQLSIASLKEGNFEDIEVWDTTAFEEVDEDGKIVSCKWLKNFIRIIDLPYFLERNIPITVCDNHNHVLAFWYEAYLDGKIEKNAELIHIDEHSDLWNNAYDISIVDNPDFQNLSPKEQAEKIYKFTNYSCNVGNYIQPALRDWLIQNIVRIENEYQVDQYTEYVPPQNSILNIDLDFFAPEMAFIEYEKKMRIIKNIIPHVRCITFATSPYFIDPQIALQALEEIIHFMKEIPQKNPSIERFEG